MKPDELAAAPPARLPFAITRAIGMPVETTDDGAAMPTMVGHFSTSGDWYEVNSMLEGHFMESVDPRAFDQTIAENRSNMKVLFDHGQDPNIGNKILGPIESLAVDDIGPAYAVPLFDTSYNRDLQPGLTAGVYGSSFRFTVDDDNWTQTPRASDYNPDALPERTITRASVMEFGPVTFPANAKADAGMRSTTDSYYRKVKDPEGFEALMRSAQVARSPQPAAVVPAPVVTPAPSPVKGKSAVEYVTRDDKAARASELKDALQRQSTEYPGRLPEAAQKQWDADTAELAELTADIKAWDARTALLREYAAAPERTETTVPTFIVRKSESDVYDLEQYNGSFTPEQRSQKLRDNAMRSVEGSHFQHPIAEDKIQAHIQRMLDEKDAPTAQNPDRELARRILQTGNPVYKRAFNKLVKGQPLSPEEQRYAALQVVGTTTTGGYAIPYTFDPTFIPTGAYTNINPYRAVCRQESIVGSNNWQGVSVGAVQAVYDAESAATTEGGPTFARPSVTAQRASSFITLSRETLQDRPDIGGELGNLIGEAKATLEENKFTLGAGTTVYPQGALLDGAFTATTTITSQVTAIADLYAIEAALPIRHRANAVWFLGRGAIRTIQGWETAEGVLFNHQMYYANAGDLPNNPPFGNTGLKLLGYPVWETPSAVTTFTAAGTIVGLLANPQMYMILDRVGMEVEVVPNMFDATTGFPNGNRGVLAIWRNTGKVLNVDAGRQIKVHA